MLFFDGVLFILLMFALFSLCVLFALILERKFPTPPLFIVKPTKKKLEPDQEEWIGKQCYSLKNLEIPITKIGEMTVKITASTCIKKLDQVSSQINSEIKTELERLERKKEDINSILEVTCLYDTEPSYIIFFKEDTEKKEDNLKISPRN